MSLAPQFDGPGRCPCHDRALTRRTYRKNGEVIREYWYCPVPYDAQKFRYRDTPRGQATVRKFRLTQQLRDIQARINHYEEVLSSQVTR